tara:strand:- start:217 stop:408 length:192 start_codon:yes stop_codon:yes gene_type:complete
MESNKNLEKIYPSDRLIASIIRPLSDKNALGFLTNEQNYFQVKLSNYLKNIEITKLAAINKSI